MRIVHCIPHTLRYIVREINSIHSCYAIFIFISESGFESIIHIFYSRLSAAWRSCEIVAGSVIEPHRESSCPRERLPLLYIRSS